MKMTSSIKESLSDEYRTRMKEIVHQLPDANILIFKRMYSHLNLDLDIDAVIDNMPDEKLEWALTQLENTIKKQEELNDQN